MSGILQFIILLGLFAVVWLCGYFRGKVIKEREMKKDFPELTKEEEDELRKLGYLD
jgi:hypothetical protein